MSSLSAPVIKPLVASLPALNLLENNKTQEIVYGDACKLVFDVAICSLILGQFPSFKVYVQITEFLLPYVFMKNQSC